MHECKGLWPIWCIYGGRGKAVGWEGRVVALLRCVCAYTFFLEGILTRRDATGISRRSWGIFSSRRPISARLRNRINIRTVNLWGMIATARTKARLSRETFAVRRWDMRVHLLNIFRSINVVFRSFRWCTKVMKMRNCFVYQEGFLLHLFCHA